MKFKISQFKFKIKLKLTVIRKLFFASLAYLIFVSLTII